MNHQIWLDTDIGSDIDDALALAFLLNRPDCELLGISTVTEIDNQRAKLASVLCRIAGQNVPIHPGARESLLIDAPQKTVPQAVALQNWAHDNEFPELGAVEAMRDAMRARPGQVTLFAIGPMTNVALLFAIDPQIPSLLKELVLMCGHFVPQNKSCEWNARNDPHATAMVYAAPVARHLSIGLDVTNQVQMERGEFENALKESKYGAPIIEMGAAWFGDHDIVTFHDPLAAVVIFEPEICTYQTGEVAVEINEVAHYGFTDWKAGGKGTHEVALGVNAPKFFELYLSTICD